MSSRSVIVLLAILPAGCGEEVNNSPVSLAYTVRVSAPQAGAETTGSASKAWISGDGRYVVFLSSSRYLTPEKTDTLLDVFVTDVQTRLITLVSRATDGTKANANCDSPRISADGRYVAFLSTATNLVPTVSGSHLYRRDLVSLQTVVVDPGTGGASGAPSISENGRFIAFQSTATDLPGAGNSTQDIFVRDVDTSTTTLISMHVSGGDRNGASNNPWISADAEFVAFDSIASNLIPSDSGGFSDVFIRNWRAGSPVTELVSKTTTGVQANGNSNAPSVSSDGRFVSFLSSAANLGSAAPEGIIVRDRQATTSTHLITFTTAIDSVPAISGDGAFVAFRSVDINIVADDTNGLADIFLYDVARRTVSRVSLSTYGGQGTGPSGLLVSASGPAAASLSLDGRFVAFDSDMTDLVPNDANGMRDIFVRGPLR